MPTGTRDVHAAAAHANRARERAASVGALGFFLTLLCLMPAQLGHAHGRPSRLPDPQPEVARLTVELELGLSAGDADAADSRSVTAFAPYAAASFLLTQAVALELALPFSLMQEQPQAPPSQRGLLSGNPAFGIHHVDRDLEGRRALRVGAMLALPLGGAHEKVVVDGMLHQVDVAKLPGHGHLMAMNGGRQALLYMPEAVGVALPISWETRSGLGLYGCDLSLVMLASSKLVALLELAPLVGVRTGALSTGARLQVAWLPFSKEGDALVSVAPFAQLELSKHAFSYARFVLNVDEPLGLLAEGPTVWGFFLGTGARL